MRNYRINIANYKINFESSSEGPELIPGERFSKYICSGADPDILIRVYSGKLSLPGGTKKVFSAPYVEEINGFPVKKKDKFWSILKNKNDLFIKTDFPLSPKKKSATLRFSLSSREWDLWVNNAEEGTDPMEYPLDGLILYYMTVIHGDIMIHASGVKTGSKGYLFSGISGKGKTTMARLWDNAGARVIHDDRLIIRKSSMGYMMYNTPVYKNDTPAESSLDRILIIEHGKKNELIEINSASSVSHVIANCIQHNWDPAIVARLLESVSLMCTSIPVVKLFFKPDRSVTEYIIANE